MQKYNFFGWIFCTFSAELISALDLAFYDTDMECNTFLLIWALFASFTAKIGQNGSKKRKKYFINVL